MAEIKTRPATPEYRENWDRIYTKVTYQIDGAYRSPEMQRALDKSMQVVGRNYEWRKDGLRVVEVDAYA